MTKTLWKGLTIALLTAAGVACCTAAYAQTPQSPKPHPAQKKPAQPDSTEQAVLLGQFGDWGAYEAAPGGKKVCFALSKPTSAKTEPAGRNRDASYAFVSTRPAEKVKNEVSMIVGYPQKPGVDAMATVGSSSYVMYTENDGAWIKNASPRAASRQDLTATLLYPRLALPAIDAAILSPSDAPRWPFDYQSIFATAFAKVSPQQGSQQCQQQPDVATATIARIRAGLATADTQMPVLQKLGSALRDASASLAASCTATVPAQPVARLQFMATQIGKLASAIGAVQQPLTDFQQSLDDEQRARFAVMISVPSASRQNQPIQNCGGNPAAMGASIDQIDHAVQPTGAQRDALTDLKQALNRAAGDFDALCQTPMPPTAPSRLEAIKARLDATSQAISSIQSALADFEAKLSDDQKTRFEAMSFAAR